MTLLDRARAAVNRGRTILASKSLREFTVSLDVETYDRPICPGAILLSTTPSTLITPAPLVEPIGGEEGTWFGAGTQFTDAGGKSVMSVYRISGLTPEYSLGGYTLLQWMAKPSGNQRFVITITGPGLASLIRGGEPFQLAEAPKRESTLENSVVVKRAPLIHTAV